MKHLIASLTASILAGSLLSAVGQAAFAPAATPMMVAKKSGGHMPEPKPGTGGGGSFEEPKPGTGGGSFEEPSTGNGGGGSFEEPSTGGGGSFEEPSGGGGAFEG